MKVPSVFGLTTAQDLMRKAEHDLVRFRANPTDVYVAFDFFVTAQNVPEWLYPTKRQKNQREKVFDEFVELRVCRHLGNAVKHLKLENRKDNRQVGSTYLSPGAWGGSWGETWGSSWGRGQLMIVLDHTDPDTTILGPEIKALELAEKAMNTLRKLVP